MGAAAPGLEVAAVVQPALGASVEAADRCAAAAVAAAPTASRASVAEAAVAALDTPASL